MSNKYAAIDAEALRALMSEMDSGNITTPVLNNADELKTMCQYLADHPEKMREGFTGRSKPAVSTELFNAFLTKCESRFRALGGEGDFPRLLNPNSRLGWNFLK